MVPTSLAIERWRSGSWGTIAGRWVVLHELALELGRSLGDLGAASLVDRLPAFSSWPVGERAKLKEALDLVHRERPGVSSLPADYAACLEALWASARSFFDLTDDPMATDQAIEYGWNQVVAAGGELKALFTLGRIPDGVVVP